MVSHDLYHGILLHTVVLVFPKLYACFLDLNEKLQYYKITEVSKLKTCGVMFGSSMIFSRYVSVR